MSKVKSEDEIENKAVFQTQLAPIVIALKELIDHSRTIPMGRKHKLISDLERALKGEI